MTDTVEKIPADLLLVDGNSLMNRAFYALSGNARLSAPDGTPTGAIFGFLTMLFAYQKEVTPTRTIVCFDRPEPTFRHLRYAAYKAGRSPMDADLATQMPILKEGLAAMGFTPQELAGYEADDLLATFAHAAAREGRQVAILSGDRDLWQLISPQITLIYPHGRSGNASTYYMTPDRFTEKYGFAAERVLDLKALMGDPSDNIPGVRGIGEKTALTLIRDYGSLEAVYAHLEEIPGARRRHLEEGRQAAEESYWLASLNDQAPLALPEAGEADLPRLKSWLERLGLRSFLSRFGIAADTPSAERRKLQYRRLQGPKELERGAGHWLSILDFVFDTAVLDEQGGFLLIPHEKLPQVWTEIIDQACELLLWGGKAWLRRFQLQIPDKPFWDAELAAYLLGDLNGSDDPTRHFLRAYQHACGEALVLGDLPSLSGTAREDEMVLRLEALRELRQGQDRLLAEQGQERLAKEVEFPLALILTQMEKVGVLVDPEKLQALSASMGREIAALEEKIFEMLGKRINLNSSRQLGEALFEDLALPGGKRSRKGTYSTAADVLEPLLPLHPVIPAILDHRELNKLRSTFVEGLCKEIGSDGRIHTIFHQSLTTTGRLSSSNPNLQNIPIRSERAAGIRDVFVAPPGSVFIDADYSQIELRLLAALSGDEAMQEAFREGVDIHLATAARIYGKSPLEVTAAERRSAKTVNFSLVYGVSEYGLSQNLGLSMAETKAVIESYHAHYPRVGPWMEAQIAQAKEKGYALTMLGRRRYIPELKSAQFQTRKFGERAAMNAPVQGSAADLIKMAMVQVAADLQKAGLKTQLILQVHDELLLEGPEEEADAAARILREGMENAFPLVVPLRVEMGRGKTWGELK